MPIDYPNIQHILGAISALGSAFCWALAAVIFRRLGHHVSAPGLNLAKSLLAVILLAVCLLLLGFEPVSKLSLVYLGLSAIIGICLGDTLYFVTLSRLGPRITLLMGTLIPVVTAVLAIVIFDERLSLVPSIGLIITIISVCYVLWEQTLTTRSEKIGWLSLSLGMIFVVTESFGILLTKAGVAEMSAIQASFVRQTVAVMGLTVWGLAFGSISHWVIPYKNKAIRRGVFVAAFIGTFLGMWLSTAALKLTYASVATALNSTSPLFILPLAAVIMKEKISKRAILGSTVAVMGIAEYFFAINFIE